MRVLALMGSPRKGGNTDLLVEEFLKGARLKGAEVDKVWLNDLKIRGCQACLACHKTGKCRQKDEMSRLYDLLFKADLWLLASPVYWWGPTAQTKAMIDRWYCLAYGDKPEIIKGKKMVLITASADSVKIATPYLFGMLREACRFLQMKWAGEIAVQAGPKGEVAKKRGVLKKARNLGARLVESG